MQFVSIVVSCRSVFIVMVAAALCDARSENAALVYDTGFLMVALCVKQNRH